MYLFPCSRIELLNYFLKRKIGAEIGVASGDYSEKLLNLCTPQKLHLIDPWVYQVRIDYQNDPNNAPNEEQEKRYRNVLQRFDSQIKEGMVEIHRAFSNETVSTFDDGYFDWVYIDGRHTFDGVLEDLQIYAPKVNPNGIIFGDDFSNHIAAKRMGFGVIEAVLEFCAQGEFSLLGITLEENPNFILVRDKNHPSIQKFLAIIQFKYINLIKISGFSNAANMAIELVSISAGEQTKDGTTLEFIL